MLHSREVIYLERLKVKKVGSVLQKIGGNSKSPKLTKLWDIRQP